MVAGIAGISAGEMRTAQVVPTDIVDGAGGCDPELVLVECGLDQVLDRRVAEDAVVDDRIGVFAERRLEPRRPGVVVADAEIVSRGSAKYRDDGLATQFFLGVIAAARAFRTVGDGEAHRP